MHKRLFSILLVFSAAVLAEQPAMEPLPDLEAPPPTGINTDDELEPEVSIIKRDDAIVHEYRMNGQLYMVKITPRRGFPYYLIDSDGDGSLESRRNQIDPAMVVPSWMIYRW
jgi:hypothetical protein